MILSNKYQRDRCVCQAQLIYFIELEYDLLHCLFHDGKPLLEFLSLAILAEAYPGLHSTIYQKSDQNDNAIQYFRQ